ncbi:MAG: DNA-binding domain-containing protein [Acidobacteriaceae bacterium]
MSLLDLQRRMAADVRRPLTPDFGMQIITENGQATATRVSAYIKPNAALTSFERLEIYNRQYWFRVLGAVSEDFPALSAVVDARRFQALVVAYLKDNPSTSFTLRNLGKNLPAWLDRHPEFTGRRHDLAVDAARLEWACVEAFDGASLPPLTESAALLASPSTVFGLQPHLQLLRLSFPVDEMVLAVHHSKPVIDIVSGAAAMRERPAQAHLPRMRRAEIDLAVHRYDDSVYHRHLTRVQFRLLSALREGHTIEAAVGHALDGAKLASQQGAAAIQETFALASRLGWIVDPAKAA